MSLSVISTTCFDSIRMDEKYLLSNRSLQPQSCKYFQAAKERYTFSAVNNPMQMTLLTLEVELTLDQNSWH